MWNWVSVYLYDLVVIVLVCGYGDFVVVVVMCEVLVWVYYGVVDFVVLLVC